MSTAKPVKKSVSFSSEEQDQVLVARADEALESGKYASFNELAKTALQHLLVADTAKRSVDEQASSKQRTAVEEQIGELITTQKALTAAVQELQKAATQSTAEIRAHEAEHFAALERALAELQMVLHHQGETLLSELQTAQVQSAAPMPDQSAVDTASHVPSIENRMRLARFLEDF
jgi:chromatin segregation and condensation protein Rec8/ScpA/Scc1 (kleisin family)